MTAPAELVATCHCGVRIEPAGGVSWRHVGRRKGAAHPASPDENTRERMREMTATANPA